MIEGSGSESGSIPLTDGSGSRRPKNMWIRWIRKRIRNTGFDNTVLQASQKRKKGGQHHRGSSQSSQSSQQRSNKRARSSQPSSSQQSQVRPVLGIRNDFFKAPDPTFWRAFRIRSRILHAFFKISVYHPVSASIELHGKLTLYYWNYDVI